MIFSSRSQGAWAQGPVAIPALRSLRTGDAQWIERGVRDFAAEWSVERHYDYEGYLSLVITGPDDEAIHMVSGTAGRMELATLRGETLRTLGTFSAVPELLGRLEQELRLLV